MVSVVFSIVSTVSAMSSKSAPMVSMAFFYGIPYVSMAFPMDTKSVPMVCRFNGARYGCEDMFYDFYISCDGLLYVLAFGVHGTPRGLYLDHVLWLSIVWLWFPQYLL